MQTFNSRSFTIQKDQQSVFNLFKSPLSAQNFLDKFGDKVDLKNIKLSEDRVELEAPMVGTIILERIEAQEPDLIKYNGVKTPVPITLSINLRPEGENQTEVQIQVDAQVPKFLSGMISKKITPGLEKAADALEKLDVDRFLGK